MIAIFSFLIIVSLSFLIVKISTVALAQTGLSRESAKFQARSALTGTGFTTSESERVVDHPVRRRIITTLMILRNAGLITGSSSLVLSFLDVRSSSEAAEHALWIVLGSLFLWIVAVSPVFDKWIVRAVGWSLKRWTNLEVRDYSSLLHLSGDYSVSELQVKENDWIESRPLKECNLTSEGIVPLGIIRKNRKYIGAPTGDTKIYAGDTLILYGKQHQLENIDTRPKGPRGNLSHVDAVAQQQDVIKEEQATDTEQAEEEEATASENSKDRR
jgi:NhaP-type Na+/H+ and K+/H+ antiporter